MLSRLTNLEPPNLAPRDPVYPPHRQLVQATAQSGPVWSGYMLQQDGTGKFRMREPVYVWEPNGLSLASGFNYMARLVGNYLGLPLLAVSVACCFPGSSVSSSPSGSLPSFSSSPSLSFSSLSASPSPSLSPSISLPSLSLSPSVSQSPISLSASPSASVSPSASMSVSVSPSASVSVSPVSSSPSFSLPSGPSLPSVSVSPSPTGSLPSFSPSVSSSSVSVSQGGIINACCPGVTIPDNLTLSITNGGALCNGSFGITFGDDPSSPGAWAYVNTIFGSCGPLALPVPFFDLICTNPPPVWTLTGYALGINQYNPTSVSCNPLQLVFTNVDLSRCGCSATSTVTITL